MKAVYMHLDGWHSWSDNHSKELISPWTWSGSTRLYGAEVRTSLLNLTDYMYQLLQDSIQAVLSLCVDRLLSGLAFYEEPR